MIPLIVYDPNTGEIIANISCMAEDYIATQEANPMLHMLQGQAAPSTHKVDLTTLTIVPKDNVTSATNA